ncbi:MAG TPA: Gldg family protein [bacterium]|nr:Gldg family protein [bacterium]
MTAGRTLRALGRVSPALAVLCGFVALMIYLFFLQFVFSAKLYLGAACVFAGLWALSRRESIERSFKKVLAAGALSFALDVASAAAIVVLSFYIFNQHKRVLDLTVNDSFTLSRFSQSMIAKLDRDIEMIGFLRANDPRITQAKDLLSQYDIASDLIKTRIIDPELSPTETARYGRDVQGKIMVRGGTNEEWSSSWQEQSVTGLIVRATSDSRPGIYFLSGHGERSVLGSAPTDLSQAAQYLRFDGFEVARLDLTSGQRVPTNASVVVLAAPTANFLPTESESLEDYLSHGGRMLFLLEPDMPDGVSQLLAQLGLRTLGGEVIDPASNVFHDPRTPAVTGTGKLGHPIATGLAGVFFPGASPIAPLKTRSPDVDVRGILLSSPASYVMSEDSDRGSEPILGPFYLAVSAEAPANALGLASKKEGRNSTAEGRGAPGLPSHPGLLKGMRRAKKIAGGKYARIVAIADVDFAANRFIDQFGNAQLVLSAVKWLSQSDEIVSIPHKGRRLGRMVLTSIDLNVIKFISIVLLPLSVAAAGAIVWYRKR